MNSTQLLGATRLESVRRSSFEALGETTLEKVALSNCQLSGMEDRLGKRRCRSA